MKKIFLLFCVVSVLIILQNTSFAQNAIQEKRKIVVTTFPIYDYVREIIGQSDSFELSLLIDNGIDLHNFQPSAHDIAEISSADLFIYNGGDSDTWVKKVISQAVNKEMKVINLMSGLGDRLKVEEIVEGMEEMGHEGHNHDDHDGHEHASHAKHDDHDDHNKPLYDEHVWLSLINSVRMIEQISQELQSVDNENSSLYQANASSYSKKLEDLHKKYTQLFSQAKNKTVIFADRFPFLYTVDDYNINYYAAFPGCSAETEASFDTIIFLANKVDELAIDKVLIIDKVSQKIADAIVRTSEKRNAEVLQLNSLQTVTQKELTSGISYYAVMQENLAILYKALQ